ncbi:hypothetical protein WG66_010827 [Moniliophthora roreri]|nr:hypothetical protein WG66_010827 [Moniliophthora roreri]
MIPNFSVKSDTRCRSKGYPSWLSHRS